MVAGRIIVVIIVIITIIVVSVRCVDGTRDDAGAVEKSQQHRRSNVKLIGLHRKTFSDAAG